MGNLCISLVSGFRHGCKTTEYKSRDSPLASFFKCDVLRESLSVDSQNIPFATLKIEGVVGNLYLCFVVSLHNVSVI